MEPDAYARVNELLALAAATPGAHVDNDLNFIGRSLGVFTSNAAELRVQLDEEEHIDTWIRLGPDNEAEFEKHLDEIDRLLHNFLAAAFTIASHTMRIRDHYPEDSFTAAYTQRAPFSLPICHLVSELRNDAQHAHLPVVRQNITIDPQGDNPPTCAMVVSRQYLASLDLNMKTREFLAGLDEDPSLIWLVDTYTHLVEDFVRWFVGAVIELRADDLVETLELRRQARELAAT